MPYNWVRPGSDPPVEVDPPTITAAATGDLYVKMDGSWAILDWEGTGIDWAVDETPLVRQGDDAFAALAILFGG